MTCTAFSGKRRIASGPIDEVAMKSRPYTDRAEPLLIFNDQNAHVVEIDFRGSAEDIVGRLRVASDKSTQTEAPQVRSAGRPKLGVVGREVTLLPRHWDWLNSQPGGASVALRKLVDEARKANDSVDRIRQSQQATYRFLSAMAGNEPGYEEALRALFASDRSRFELESAKWPKDVREYAANLAADSFFERNLRRQ
jgi:hypothetical protein